MVIFQVMFLTKSGIIIPSLNNYKIIEFIMGYLELYLYIGIYDSAVD